MLTEGWDANTVTHVLGVRAFGTQLLCEQVIGRALRRQSYELNEDGPDRVFSMSNMLMFLEFRSTSRRSQSSLPHSRLARQSRSKQFGPSVMLLKSLSRVLLATGLNCRRSD